MYWGISAEILGTPLPSQLTYEMFNHRERGEKKEKNNVNISCSPRKKVQLFKNHINFNESLR